MSQNEKQLEVALRDSPQTFEEWHERYVIALGDHSYLVNADLESNRADYERCLAPEATAAADVEFVNSSSKKDARYEVLKKSAEREVALVKEAYWTGYNDASGLNGIETRDFGAIIKAVDGGKHNGQSTY